MVCLTLFKSDDDPENWASNAGKCSTSYPCMLLSTMQHMQLVKALRERCRLNGEDAGGSIEEKLQKKKEQIKMLKDQSIEQQEILARLQGQHQELHTQLRGPNHALLERLQVLRQQNQQLRDAVASSAGTKQNAAAPLTTGDLVPTPEVQRLRDELVDVTSEANARIDKANSSIQTLKAKLKSLRDIDMPHHQQNKADLMKRCEELQRLTEEERKRLEQGSVAEGGEISQLRHELEVIVNQKTALMKIVQDLYGSVAETPASGPVPKESNDSNLLPSPRSLVGGDLKPL